MKTKTILAVCFLAAFSSVQAVNICKNEYYSDADGKTVHSSEQAGLDEMWGKKKVKKIHGCDMCYDGALIMAKAKCKDPAIKSFRRMCQKTSIFLTNGGADRSASLNKCSAL